MINPTSEWMSKHGYSAWEVRVDLDRYIHTLKGFDARGKMTKRTEVSIDIRMYEHLQTDTQRRKLLYDAILEEADESGSDTDVNSGGDRLLPESDRTEGAAGVTE